MSAQETIRQKIKATLDALSHREGLKVESEADLSRSGTLKLKARGHIIKAQTIEALQEAIKVLTKNGIDYRPLGLGANSLIEDAFGFVYLKFLENKKNAFDVSASECEFSASTTLNKLTNLAIKYELQGWEVFTGVPATLGGAVVMNAGTNLGEIGDIVSRVKYVNSAGELKEHIVGADSFVYRNNTFLKKGDFVYAVVLKNLGVEAGIARKIEDYLELRNKTQPLWDKTCGCTFKNYKTEDRVLPAGMYIDLAGLKGLEYGNMKVSEKHANFFINKENATKQEVVDFILFVQEILTRSYGVTFEREIKID